VYATRNTGNGSMKPSVEMLGNISVGALKNRVYNFVFLHSRSDDVQIS
jgi:hypothetical protein